MKVKLFFVLLCLSIFSSNAWGACGAITRTWDGGNGTNGTNGNYWATNSIWDSNNAPNTSNENAVVPSAGVGYLWVYPSSFTVGCVEVTSGLLGFWTLTMTVTGDYFRALTPTSVYLGQTTGRLTMAGTAAQTLEMVDTLPNLTISNNTSVTFTNSFKSNNAPVMSGTTTTLFIDDDFEVINNSAWTIPSGVTVHIRNGATVTIGGNMTVNGTLIIDAGGRLELANGRTLSVPSGGLIQLNGSSGNPVAVETGSGGTFTFNVAGSFNGQFFRISRTNANGVNVSGTIQRMEFGEFHNIANSGYGLTIGSGVTLPSTMEGLGFFNEGGSGSGNIDASAYAGSASDVFIDNWLGDLGGEGSDLDSNGSCGGDPPGCIEWGTEAGTSLTITDNTASGSPPNNIAVGSADTLFATYAFALTKASTATDITSMTFTQVGSASITEVGALKVYEDTNGNCAYNAGTDTQIGSDLTLTGTPQQATISIPASTVTVSNTTPVCIHLISSASSLGVRSNTISFEVQATGDVVNSTGYDFSISSGPPVNTGFSVITDGFSSQWTGANSTSSTTNSNWFLNDPPSATENCQIGEGERICRLNANLTCKTAELPSAGTLDFNGFNFNVHGNITVDSGYTFTNASGRNINMVAAVNQGFEMNEPFPGNLVVNNSGASGNDKVIVTGTSEVQGNVTVTNGVLNIGNGVILTVGGNVTVQTGGEIEIEPGGKLVLSDGSALTVNSGGTLTLVGNASKEAEITSVDTSSSYTITVNGTIEARFYKISRLGGNGLTINSGATIDGTNHLQNGSFSYPVTASTTFLRLFRAVPTNTMDNMTFESGGSAAGSITNISTDASIGAGTLTINTYSGNLSGPTFDNDNTYLISWTGATNTLDIAQDATAPGGVDAGDTVIMGRLSFEQSQAGASFNDTDITSLKVTVQGTGNSTDIDSIKLYYDDDCNSSGGTLIGTQSPSGNPASATFAITAGNATVEADAATPPTRCIYVEYDIAAGASDGKTIGAKIQASGDVVNSESFAASGTSSFPISMGTSTITGSTITIWTGAVSTDWFNAANWSAGLPSQTKSCQIPNAANDPVINGGTGTAICDDVDITNGILTFQNSTGASLEVYGNFENSGTVTQNDGSIVMRDDGATATNQRLESSTAITSVTFNKTAGGQIQVGGGSTVNLSTLTFPASQNFTFIVQAGNSLSLSNSVSIPSGVTFRMEGSSTLTMASGQSINVTGGTFQTTGTNDAYPQTTTNKATITTSSGRFSFNASSGSVTLQGFILNNIDVNGLQITGTANLTQLDGGQFTNLIQDFATPVSAITLNTSTTITETTASNVGFNWGAANATYNSPPSPDPSDNYNLVKANACGSQSLSFSQWFGDFWGSSPQPNTQDKIIDSADSGANTCTVSIDVSAAPVTLTELKATPYNGVVDIEWTTGSELDHLGFNVYRSVNMNSGYVQVNSQIIKNIATAGSAHGDYIFRDETVTNGFNYFYYIEDVAFNGTTTMHGPVSAKPLANLAGAPALSGEHSGSDEASDDATDGSDAEGNKIQIAPDVHILSSSGSTFRIEIIPSAESTNPSGWNASFNEISIPHFSRTTQEGHPEILERTILVPTDQSYEGVSSSQVNLTQAAPVNLKITPAPHWTLNSSTGQLEPSWTPDAATYSTNAYVFDQFYEVMSDTVQVGEKHFIAIKVWPIKYNPVAEDYIKATKIILDVFTGSSAWQNPAETLASVAPPHNAENVALLSIAKSGMYELAFEDLVQFNSEGPFSGVNTSELRAFVGHTEVPLEVISADSFFGAGDKLRFYAPHGVSTEDKYSYVVLASRDLYSDGAALRIGNVSSPVVGHAQTVLTTTSKVRLEQNNMGMFDVPLGGQVDHYFWRRLVVSPVSAGSASAYLDTTVNLENLDLSTVEDIYINVDLRGRGTDFNANPEFKLGLFLNGSATASAVRNFSGTNKQVISFAISSDQFVSGSNSLRVKALPDNLGAGEFALIDIDKIEVDYPRSLFVSTAQLEIQRSDLFSNVKVSGFSSEPSVYDVSYLGQVKKVSDFTWTAPGAEVSEYSFNTVSEALIGSDGGPVGVSGSKFIALNESQFLEISAAQLSSGYSQPLKGTEQQADYLLIGFKDSLSAAQKLADHRANQGLSVRSVELQQIYNEFSSGRKSSAAIQEFLNFAYDQWQSPKLKYVVMVGDSSVDPMNHEEYDVEQKRMASYLVSGQHSDFPSDVIYAAKQDENGIWIPRMAVGRIPSSDYTEISQFVDKLIAYEKGERLSSANANKLVFVSDKTINSEGFNDLSDNLKETAVSSFKAFSDESVSRDNYTDAQLNAKIKSFFEQTQPLLITLNGHGAEDIWADGNVFSKTDAQALQNSDSLPMVVALNCLNGYSQFADPDEKGLGESLVLQKNGAVAFWGSTTLTTPRTQEALATEFYSYFGQKIADGETNMRMGDAILHAQNALNKTQGYQDVLLSWSFVGDPAMKLPQKVFPFSASTAVESRSPASGELDDGGGAACGLVKPPPGGASGGPSASLWLMFLLPMLTYLGLSRRQKLSPVRRQS